jgi:GNAT superfamily N-acetyltransferase
LPSAASLDAYFDAVPRPDTDPVEAGPFTLFVSRRPWGYYARPALAHRGALAGADIDRLGDVCQDYGVELTIEWVGQVHPELAAVAAQRGLDVHTYTLMAAAPGQGPAAVPEVPGTRVRVLSGDEPDAVEILADARATANVAFDCPHGAPGPDLPGPAERDANAARMGPELLAHIHARAQSGLTVTAVAESDDDGVLATGCYQPVAATAEIVGVATLPSARRRGLATLLTAVLAAHARQRGVRTLVLSAQDEAVARIYGRVGFVPIGTSHSAERARA